MCTYYDSLTFTHNIIFFTAHIHISIHAYGSKTLKYGSVISHVVSLVVFSYSEPCLPR